MQYPAVASYRQGTYTHTHRSDIPMNDDFSQSRRPIKNWYLRRNFIFIESKAKAIIFYLFFFPSSMPTKWRHLNARCVQGRAYTRCCMRLVADGGFRPFLRFEFRARIRYEFLLDRKPYNMQSKKFTVIIHQVFMEQFSLSFYVIFLCGCVSTLLRALGWLWDCETSSWGDRLDISARRWCVTTIRTGAVSVCVCCASVMYDYRSRYDVESTTMFLFVCATFFRMCETITNKNTRTLISLSLNVISSRCLLFIFIFVPFLPIRTHYPQRVCLLSTRSTTRMRERVLKPYPCVLAPIAIFGAHSKW